MEVKNVGRNITVVLIVVMGLLITENAGAQTCLAGNIPLQWYGGGVLHNPKVYIDYWGWGSPAQDPNNEINNLQEFIGAYSGAGSGIANTRWMNTVTQYFD